MSSPRTSTRPSVHITSRSPGAHPHRDRLEGHPADADGRARRQVEQFAAAVLGADQDRRDVARVGEVQLARDRVVDRVQAGREVVLAEPLRQVVEVAQELGGRQVQGGHGLYGRTQLAHHRGRVEAVAHDVADDERGARAGQFDGVEPVAADPAEQRARADSGSRCRSPPCAAAMCGSMLSWRVSATLSW